MRFSVDEIGDDQAVVRCVGRLNMVSAPVLRTTATEVITRGRVRVTLDLSGVEFMDSTGLAALVGCLKTARQAGGDLRIAAPSSPVLLVLKLSNIDRILKPYDDVQTALDG